MALNGSGPISLAGSTTGESIAVELGLGATSQISLNDAAVRTLAGVPSGAIVMPTNFYGKANEFAFTISSNTTNANLATLATNAGWNGTTKVVATIGSGIYVYSTSTGTPGLTVPDSFPNGVEIINNGFILGMGGNGNNPASGITGSNGGTALNILRNVTITNNSYIAGGGGGGGGGYVGYDFSCNCGGGGGAGGGQGAGASSPALGNTAGGGPGSAGSNGSTGNSANISMSAAGGGGGRILPGTGGASRTPPNPGPIGGLGGGAGGSGGAARRSDHSGAGGGGGGWGASGGDGNWNLFGGGVSVSGAGGSANNNGSAAAGGNNNSPGTGVRGTGQSGGKAVNLNGFSVTWIATGNRYGAIS